MTAMPLPETLAAFGKFAKAVVDAQMEYMEKKGA